MTDTTMRVRSYVEGDAAATLAVFGRAIRTTAAEDYAPHQIAAWSTVDPVAWGTARAARSTVVAELEGEVVGFADVDAQGYIDMLYVDPCVARRGVATGLLEEARRRAEALGACELRAYASITARPFFEHHGFVVRRERRPQRRGVTFVNFEMVRALTPRS